MYTSTRHVCYEGIPTYVHVCNEVPRAQITKKFARGSLHVDLPVDLDLDTLSTLVCVDLRS